MPMAIGHRCRPPPDLLRRSSARKRGRRKRAPSSPSGGGAPQARRGQVRAFAALCDPRIRNRTQRFQPLPTFTPRSVIRVETARILSSPRREERAHGQRPFAAAGGDRAGTGPRGILGRSGDGLAGLTRPPSAWLKAEGCVLACSGSSSSTAGVAGSGELQVPVRPEQGHLTGRWRITVARSVRASSKRYFINFFRTNVRRSASLSIPSAGRRVKSTLLAPT